MDNWKNYKNIILLSKTLKQYPWVKLHIYNNNISLYIKPGLKYNDKRISTFNHILNLYIQAKSDLEMLVDKKLIKIPYIDPINDIIKEKKII